MSPKLARLLLSFCLALGLLARQSLQPGQTASVQAAGGSTYPEWVLNGSAIPGNVASAQFGAAMAASSDGSRYVVGANAELVSGKANQGAAYIFMKTGLSWTSYRIQANDGAAGDHFGISVAISGDGSTVLVGAYLATVNGYSKQGAAYVFGWNGSAWSQKAKLEPALAMQAANEFFGTSVALDNTGHNALVGATGFTNSQNGQGGAFQFYLNRLGTAWLQFGTYPLMAFDAAAGDSLGSSVALSDDGGTALVGAPGKSTNQGAAYVYAYDTTSASWLFQDELLAWDGGAGDDFARSVSLSSNGSVALIGSDNAPLNGHITTGVAYTFTRSGAFWSNGVKLAGSDSTSNDWFGYSASLSRDGSVAVLGAPHATVNLLANEGAAYVFYGNNFSQQHKLISTNPKTSEMLGSAVATDNTGLLIVASAPDMTWGVTNQGGVYEFDRYDLPWIQRGNFDNPAGNTNDYFGVSQALSSDGTTLIIGSNNMNTVFVYGRAHGLWALQAKIPSNDPDSINFGYSVAISADGNTALVGAWRADTNLMATEGAAYLLTRTGATWSAPTLVTSPDGASGDGFGSSVALSADGNTAAIAAADKNTDTGEVYVMTRSGTTWSALSHYTASDAFAGMFFGTSLALSSDGSTLLAGAEHGSNGTAETGAAYVLVRSGSTYSEQKKLFPSSGYGGETNFGYAVALSGDGNTAVIGAPFWGSGDISGLVYIYVRTGTTWSQQTGFEAQDFSSLDRFGHAVAVSTDGNTAVIGGPRALSDGSLYVGAAYVYVRSGATWTFTAKIISPNAGQADQSAWDLAVSGDGHTIVFDANDKDGSRGGFYIFEDHPAYPSLLPLIRH